MLNVRGQIAEIYQDVSSGARVSRLALSRLMLAARAREFNCLLVWKLDRFGRSHVDCLNNIKTLEENGVRFIAVTQGLDTDLQNPTSRFLLHVLGAAAEFEGALIRERTQAGQMRYKQDFENGRVGKTVYSRSGRNMAPHRPQKVFDVRKCFGCGTRGGHFGKSRGPWAWAWGRSSGRCRGVPKVRVGHLEHGRRNCPPEDVCRRSGNCAGTMAKGEAE
jgi:hypothetical protein